VTGDAPLGSLLAERVRLLQMRFASEIEGLSPEELRASGRALDWPKQQALKVVAEERGVTVRHVRQEIRKWSQKEERMAGLAARRAAALRGYFETYGRAVEESWVQHIIELSDQMHEAWWYATKVERMLHKLKKDDFYPSDVLKLALQRIKDLVAVLQDVTPCGLCPYCKCVPEVMAECAPCFTKGVLLEGQMASVPAKYLSTRLPVVLSRGADHPLCEFKEAMLQEEMWG